MLTSDLLTPTLIVSRPCPVDLLCQFAAKSVCLFSKSRFHKFGDGWISRKHYAFGQSKGIDSRRRLRSASTAEVLIPAAQCSTIGDRAVAGPRSWNNLPVDLRPSRTFSTFKTHLKSRVQHIIPFSLTVSLTIFCIIDYFFVQSPWSRLCCIRLMDDVEAKNQTHILFEVLYNC